jgi:hypothetical protein
MPSLSEGHLGAGSVLYMYEILDGFSLSLRLFLLFLLRLQTTKPGVDFTGQL